MSSFDHTKRIEQEYWVDRYGKKITYTPEEGEDLSEIISMHDEILRQMFGFSTTITREEAGRSFGWVLVGSCCYCHPLALSKPTQDQINTLFDEGYQCLEETVFNGTNTRVWFFHRR